MNERDRILQEKIEKGKTTAFAQRDERAYKIVFDSLKSEPSFSLPPSFSEIVVKRINSAKESQSQRSAFIWLCVGLSVFIGAAIFAIVVTGFKFAFGTFIFLRDYRVLLFFATILICALQFAEKRLLKKESPPAVLN